MPSPPAVIKLPLLPFGVQFSATLVTVCPFPTIVNVFPVTSNGFVNVISLDNSIVSPDDASLTAVIKSCSLLAVTVAALVNVDPSPTNVNKAIVIKIIFPNVSSFLSFLLLFQNIFLYIDIFCNLRKIIQFD